MAHKSTSQSAVKMNFPSLPPCLDGNFLHPAFRPATCVAPTDEEADLSADESSEEDVDFWYVIAARE
jgi:hypothetical protein